MLWGERCLNIDGTMTFIDKDNGIKAVVIFQHGNYHKYIGKLY
jgi:hypothetical protein